MSTKRAPTLRTKLVMLVLACVLPASLMAIVLITHDYQRSREHLLFNLLTTARTVMSVFDRDLASIESSLIALGTSPNLKNHDLRAFHAQALSMLKNQSGAHDIYISLIDANGQIVMNTRRAYGQPLPHANPAVGYDTIRRTNKPNISDVFIGRFTGEPMLSIGVPTTGPYTLHATLKPDRFYRLLQQQHLPSEWIVAIFDSQNNIIVRSREMARYVGKKASPSMLEKLTSGESNFITTSHDNVQVHTAVGRSSVSSWSLALGIPVEFVDKELRQTMVWLILSTIILIATSLTMAWLIAGRIAESIRGLTGPALALGSGEIVSVPPLHLQEADDVGMSLVKVSQMLHHAQHRANHDALTGLANRSLFNEMLEQHLSLCERNASMLSILYIDLDGFKAVNDRHGHDVGDRLLCMVAARMRAGSRQSDLVARIGGDEFAIVMVGSGKVDNTIVAQKMIDILSAPYELDGMSLHISASIGVASYPESGITVDALLQRADGAMYRAKEMGRKRVETDSAAG